MLLFGTIFDFTSSFGFRCGADDLKKNAFPPIPVKVKNKKRTLEDQEYQPIRIYIDDNYLQNQKKTYSEEKINGLIKVLGEVTNIFQSLIKVIPLDKLVFKGNSTTLKRACFTSYINEEIVKNGIDYDVVIYPFYYSLFESNVIAGASNCIYSSSTHRPVGGYVAINPSNVDFSSDNSYLSLKYTLLHEITHSLVFDPELFKYFTSTKSPTKLITVNGIQRTILTTPKVIEKAKTHFDCQTLEGLELENQGSTGSAGCHWEARTMLGDYMISTNYPEVVISDITLALFEDSGWYQVNYYTGGLFRFGKGQGCSFLNSKCIESDTTIYNNEFCLSHLGPRCGNARLSTGFCYLSTYKSKIDQNYQYFSNPYYGGFSPADYCPVFYDTASTLTNYATHCKFGNAKYSNVPNLGETIGENSICLLSSLRASDYKNELAKYTSIRAICHEIECDSASKVINIKIGDKVVICPQEGGVLTNPSGFEGTIECPDYNSVCTTNKGNFCVDIEGCIEKKAEADASTYIYSYQRGNTLETGTKASVPSTSSNSGNTATYYGNSFYISNKSFIISILIFLLIF